MQAYKQRSIGVANCKVSSSFSLWLSVQDVVQYKKDMTIEFHSTKNGTNVY